MQAAVKGLAVASVAASAGTALDVQGSSGWPVTLQWVSVDQAWNRPSAQMGGAG